MSTVFTKGGLLAALFFAANLPAAAVTYNVSLTLAARAISPLVYGCQENSVPGATLRRVGGNRMTGYNWETNASNAGNDYLHNSDYWLLSQVGLPQNAAQGPARFLRERINQARADKGKAELITLQAAGYVAADGAGVVSVAETAPSARWKAVQAKKGAAFLLAPDTADGTVFMDEEINYLQSVYGTAAGGGIKYYCIDNEPDIWSGTHVRIHPTPVTYAELVSRTASLSTAILDQDPAAEVFGFVSYGWSGYTTLQGAVDSGTYNPSYSNYFIGYFLSQMQAASTAQGRRLVHFLDLHWYPEAQGLNASSVLTRITNPDVSAGVRTARVQAPRSLWDTAYLENSWIVGSLGNQAIRLIPRLRTLITTYNPGTKLAFSEWQYGDVNDISVALASVDALGIYGRYADAASYFGGTYPYTTSAFKLYLDYDGAGHAYGDRALTATASDKLNGSVHAAYDSLDPERVTVIVLNKDAALTQTAQVDLGLNAGQSLLAVQSAWRIGPGGSAIVAVPTPAGATASGFSDSLPPYSATLYVLRLQAAGSPTATPTVTGTYTSSPTRSATRTSTVTLTLTATRTHTLTRTPTPTPSLTLSATLTRSPTPSSSPSHTPTLTPTPTFSPTTSPSFSATSTVTLSPVLSSTLTATLSPVLSPTPTATLSITSSVSPTPTLTTSSTLSATPTLTHTVTVTASETGTETASPSATLTPTDSTTLTSSPSPSATRTITATLTATPLQSASPTPAPDGPLVVEELALGPQPLTSDRGRLYIKLLGPADAMECRVYTANLVMAKLLTLPGNYQAGWNQATFDASGLANGTYFCRVTPLRGGRRGEASRALRLYLAR